MKRKEGDPHSRQSAHHDPKKIGDLLTDVLAHRGYAQVSIHEECQRAWCEAVGDLQQFSRATEVRRGVLLVVVSNSVVMQELTFRKSELIALLATSLPKFKISDLRFKVGKIS